MGVFFTSDLHILHRAVSYDRRYGGWPADKSLVTEEDVQWHSDMLAENWDSVVRQGDTVWFLGDLIANNKSLDAALEWVKARPGTKHCIAGNHDPVHPMHREAYKFQRKYLEAFESVQSMATRDIALPTGAKQRVMLSHFPYSGDGDAHEDRATQFRLRDEGLPLLHGHVHTKDVLTYTDREMMAWTDSHTVDLTTEHTAQVHVGLDAWGLRPVALEQIAELL